MNLKCNTNPQSQFWGPNKTVTDSGNVIKRSMQTQPQGILPDARGSFKQWC
jgi:hypothetical protein